jgi:hypothetical protein
MKNRVVQLMSHVTDSLNYIGFIYVTFLFPKSFYFFTQTMTSAMYLCNSSYSSPPNNVNNNLSDFAPDSMLLFVCPSSYSSDPSQKIKPNSPNPPQFENNANSEVEYVLMPKPTPNDGKNLTNSSTQN